MLGIFKSTYCSAAKPQVRYPTRTCRLDRRPLPVAFPLLGEHEPRQVWHSLKPQGLKACLPWHTRILSQKNSESHASPPFRYVYCVKTQVKNAGHRHAICIEKLQAPLDVFTGAPLCGATQ